MICQELIHTLRHKQGQKGAMIYKIDLEKAYDWLGWNFIKSTLEDVGLLIKMMEIVMECIINASFCLLLNGELTELVTPSQGIR